MKKLIFIISIFFFLQTLSFAQLSSKDSLRIYENTKTLVELQIQDKVDFYEKLGFGSILFTTVIGGLIWFLGIKKKAEEAIKEKSGEIIETKLKEKIGVNWVYLGKLADEAKRNDEMMQTPLLIIRKTDKSPSLTLKNAIKDAGYTKDLECVLLSEITTGNKDISNYRLVFDCGNENLTETDAIEFIKNHRSKNSMLIVTQTDWKTYNELQSDTTKFVKDISRFGFTLKNMKSPA